MAGIFDAAEFKPYKAQWDARLKELQLRRSYYDGSIYTRYRETLGWMWPRLYKGVKPLYLPLARAVDVDAGIVPGGWSFPEEIPETTRQAWAAARQQLWNWSKWQTRGVLYVHYGAQYGLSGLKVSDLRQEKRVILAPVDPTHFLLTYNHQYSETPSMAIWVETRQDIEGEDFEYGEVVTDTEIRTFRDGTPEGFDEREAEYKNELGFVPYVEVKHMETGHELGDATFVKTIPMLDEVNQLASYLGDIIAKHAEPQWVITGADKTDLVKSGDNVWFLPEGAAVDPVLPQIDIAGVLEFVREIAGNVKDSLPELAFDELRSKDQIATATVELQLIELVLKVKRMRPNYDDGMTSGLQMAGRAAQSMGIGEIGVLNTDDLAIDSERPVLPLDQETLMRLEMQALELEQMRATSINEGKSNGAEPPAGTSL